MRSAEGQGASFTVVLPVLRGVTANPSDLWPRRPGHQLGLARSLAVRT
jgi:hypothetical protein